MDRLASRRAWLLVAALTVVAAALRLPLLGHQSLWFDEIYTRDVVGEHSLPALWNHIKATESTPPLYYLLAWLQGARSAAALRLIPALATVAAVPVSYLAFRRLIGVRAALAAAAIMAVTPELVEYGLDARAYGLLVLTVVLSLWGFAEVLECDDWRRRLGWAAACTACVWTHYFGGFVVLAEVVVLLALRPAAWRRTVAWSAAIAALLVPLVPLVTEQSGDERAAFIGGTSLAMRLQHTVREFAMGANVPRTALEAAGLLLAASAVVAAIVMAARGERRIQVVAALAALTFGVPLLLAASGLEDRLYARNMLIALPLAAALAAPALVRLRAAPLALYLALCVATSVWVMTDWRYEQADWRTAIARTQALDPRAAVVAITERSGAVASTYLGRPPVPAPVAARAAWLVVEPYRAAHSRALGPAPVPPNIPAGMAGFTRSREQIVHGFRLIRYTAPSPQPLDPGRLSPYVFAPNPDARRPACAACRGRGARRCAGRCPSGNA